MRDAEVLRTSDLASVLGADPNRIDSVLETLAQYGLLRSEVAIECVHCGMAALRSDFEGAREDDGEYRCTSCDQLLADDTALRITTYRRGAKWKNVPKPARSVVRANTVPDDQAWYSPAGLAAAFGLRPEALRKRLDRYRKRNLNGWKQNEDPRPREARYLYRPKDVKAIIDDLRASSERPAK